MQKVVSMVHPSIIHYCTKYDDRLLQVCRFKTNTNDGKYIFLLLLVLWPCFSAVIWCVQASFFAVATSWSSSNVSSKSWPDMQRAPIVTATSFPLCRIVFLGLLGQFPGDITSWKGQNEFVESKNMNHNNIIAIWIFWMYQLNQQTKSPRAINI